MKLCALLFLVISVTCLGLAQGNSRRSDGSRQQNSGKGDSSDTPFWAARGKRERTRNELSGLIKYEFVKTPSLAILNSLADSPSSAGSDEDSLSNWPNPLDQQQQQLQLNLEKAMPMQPWSFRMKRTSFLPEESPSQYSEISTSPWLSKSAGRNSNGRRNPTISEYFSALLGLAAADRDREKKNGDKDAKAGDVPFWAARG